MAAIKKVFAFVGATILVYVAVSLFFFLFSIGNQYSDGDLLLRGILNLHVGYQLSGLALIFYAIVYGFFHKEEIKEKLKKLTWRFFSGE